MAWRGSDASVVEHRFPRPFQAVVWLRSHRGLVVVLAVAGIALSFALDLLIPGYAIAGFYLLPILLVTFALSERRAVVILVSSAWVSPSAPSFSRIGPTSRTSCSSRSASSPAPG